MMIYLSPQLSDRKIYYKFTGEVVEIIIDDIKESFDFSGTPDGILDMYNIEGDLIFDTKMEELEEFPIRSAEKKEGILYLELLNWIGDDASYEERFPEWIDAKDYYKYVK